MTDQPAGRDKQAEGEAQRAARNGDPVGMLDALARSSFLERLAVQIQHQFRRLDEDDCRWVVSKAVDALYSQLVRGERKRDIFPYLLGAAKNIARDVSRELARRVPFNEELDGAVEVSEPMTDAEREAAEDAAEAKRRAMYAEVRRLATKIPQARPRQVISYVVDAMEKGVLDLTNEEIGDALGLSKGTVATAKCRGFDFLIELAKEENLADFDFTAADLELSDEAEAIAAADEEEKT